ncbi:lipopolysaccharide biosynthesis protein [Rhizobium tumorigenes]|uniref:lipopolysaccharide biosynthesis protein n=1 Tax=Rhizobium tumorigenes TaxID=2041385 RepID=UPI00241F56B7|nr:lipopolysaccharide biosynthesis protein [Rhizobium tumorigenes]WFS03314.1 lipopolysaccharide biosynthesis protein [Rhizobium tumorigenes]
MLAFKAMKGAGWLVVSRFAGRIIDFFTLLFLARLLTPADFGLAALAMSLVVVVDTVLEVPVTQALVRLPAIDKSHLDTGFTLSLLRSVAIALIVMSAAWPFSMLNHNPQLFPLIAVLAIGPIVRGFYSPGMVNFTRAMAFQQTFLVEFSGKLGAFVVATVTVFSGGSYWAIVANIVSASIVTAIASYMIAPYRPALSLRRFADFSGFIGWFSLSQLISALNWQFDRFLIGYATNSTILGRYAVASDISVIPTQSIIGPALQPVMSAFSQISSDTARLRLAFLKAARFAMLISFPVCIGISLTSDLITDLLLGSHWSSAAPYLSILALAVIPIPYFQTLYSLSMSLNQAHLLFKINVIDLCIRVALVSLGYALFSVVGVSYARVAVSAIMFAINMLYVRHLLKLPVLEQLKNIWKIALAAAAMVTVVLVGRPSVDLFVLGHIGGYELPRAFNLFLKIGAVALIGAVTYAAVLYCLGLRIHVGRNRFGLSDNRW